MTPRSPLVRTLPVAGAVAMSCSGLAHAQIAPPPPPEASSYWRELPEAGQFVPTRRPGVAPLEREFDVTDLSIPADEVHLLLPRGAIPALFDPKTELLMDARSWLGDSIVVLVDLHDHPDANPEAGPDLVGVPVRILNLHEVVNLDVAGIPVAVTYSPLSDCIAVFDRRVPRRVGDGGTIDEVLELEVSGALLDANVLMYDRNTRGLWSQMQGRSVGGLFAGTRLRPLALAAVPATSLGEELDAIPVVSRETGYERIYERDAYAEFIEGDSMLVAVKEPGTALAPKTQGLVVSVDRDAGGQRSWFIPRETVLELGGEATFRAGRLSLRVTAPGGADGRGLVAAVDDPGGLGPLVCTALYVAWSGMHPEGVVVEAGHPALSPTAP